MNILLKSDSELKIMEEGGKIHSNIKKELRKKIKIGVKASEIEKLATTLINQSGAKPSFKMVPNYKWSTCVNVNEGVVHGIPHNAIKFKKSDVVSVDLGVYYKGLHTDSAFSVLLGDDDRKKKFLKHGETALNKAIKATLTGNTVKDISQAMQLSLESNNLVPIKSLTGHGIGKSLHEDPRIPCFVTGDKNEKVSLAKGMVLAIEVMYTIDSGDIMLGEDGWTLSTKNDKISALFEETVAVTSHGPLILTK